MGEPNPLDYLTVKCGKCGGQIHFNTCPKHDWVLESICLDCGFVSHVEEVCHECDKS